MKRCAENLQDNMMTKRKKILAVAGPAVGVVLAITTGLISLYSEQQVTKERVTAVRAETLEMRKVLRAHNVAINDLDKKMDSVESRQTEQLQILHEIRQFILASGASSGSIGHTDD